MIALAVAIVLALALSGLAYVARLHPVLALRRGIQASAAITAVIALVAGLVLMPASQSWQASLRVSALEAQTDAELSRATRMIKVLGSPAAYIEYLKATKAD